MKVNKLKKLILASGSPRRKELLSLLNIPFEIVVSDVNEEVENHLTPVEVVIELSRRKATEVSKMVEDGVVIGSDTIVVVEGEILNKPLDAVDAKNMLSKLSNKTHCVYTGVTLIEKETVHSFYEETKVTFWDLTERDIHNYIQTGEPFDKAGAYGIQGFGALLVRKVEGEYASVVGLPIARLNQELKRFTSF